MMFSIDKLKAANGKTMTKRKAIAEEMRSGGRSSFGAAKLLLDRGWLDKEAASQAKRKLQEKEEEEMNKEALLTLNEDAERLGLNKLN
jgi:hypothetical protein